MRMYLWTTMLVILSATMSFAQLTEKRNAAADNPPPQGERGGPAGSGPMGFFGPPTNVMFNAIDADADGVITKAELRKAIVALRKLDADKDGNITLAEVSPAGGPMGPGGPGGDPARFVERMMENDKNGDGKLTAEELPGPMAQMVQDGDKNGDGALDREELTAAVEEMNKRFRSGPGGDNFPGGPGAFGPGFGGQGNDPARITGQLMQNDRNGDGKLTPDEVPQRMMGMLRDADTNGDGALEPGELQAVMARMGDRARAFGSGRGGEALGGQGRGGPRGGRPEARPE